MRARKEEEIIQINLRLPRALHRLLVQKAKKARRSLNAEMAVRLEQSLGENNEWLLEHVTAQREQTEKLFNLMLKNFGMPPVQPNVYGILAHPTKVGKPIPPDATKEDMFKPLSEEDEK